MKKLTLILATALMMTACANSETQKTPAINPANFDETVVRNDNFYQWATGGWQQNNPLKPECSRLYSSHR